MPRDYNSIIGSGCTPNLALSPPYDFVPGTFPVPDQRHSLRNRQGDGTVILNPENFSVSIGFRNQVVSVTSTVPLPINPLEFRRSIAFYNGGPGILYIGLSTVTTADGFPILVGEKIALDAQGTPGIIIYGVSDSTSDVRILELS